MTMSNTPSDRSVKQASMFDVAKLAGVSAQTVSRVSNGSSSVKEETRDRVVDAMRQLGYRPNAAARALKRGRFHSIGVITFTLGNYGNLHTVEAIAEAAAAEGYSITLIQASDRTMGSVSGAYDRLAEASVDAVALIIEARMVDREQMEFPPGLPIVIIDSDVSAAYPLVDTDQAEGARLATEHLLELGHRRIAHVSGPSRSFSSTTRSNAFAATLAAADLEPVSVLEGNWTVESGYQAGAALIASGATGVFVSNDEMALGVIRYAHEHGIAVPEALSVVGFDNSTAAQGAWPALTSIDQNFDAVGKECVRMLLESIDSTNPPIDRTLIPTRLIVRGSTAAAPIL